MNKDGFIVNAQRTQNRLEFQENENESVTCQQYLDHLVSSQLALRPTLHMDFCLDDGGKKKSNKHERK